jgi:hypothetical protein
VAEKLPQKRGVYCIQLRSAKAANISAEVISVMDISAPDV